MGQQERVARWHKMIEPVRNRDVSWWAAAFLKVLGAQQSEPRRAPTSKQRAAEH
jgi:trehalose-6-phosphate synthase